MNKIIKKVITLIFILTGGLLSSCINDPEGPTSDTSSTDRVMVKFHIGGNALNTVMAASDKTSRETENGDDALNENTVQRLDMFIINTAGKTIDQHYTVTADNLPGDDIYKYDTKTQTGTWLLPNLKQADVTGKRVYLVANWDGATSVNTLEDLKIAKVKDFSTPEKKQATFLMDGNSAEWKTSDVDKSYVVKVGIKRALAKIRLIVKDADGNEITTKTDLAYQIVNYGTNAAVLAESEDSTTTILASLPDKDTFNYGDGMLSPDKIQQQNNKVIFYTYPNNWWNGKYNPYQEEPINSKRQTYILLKAPFNGTEGYYKIPVNNRLPENNDSNLNETEWKPILAGLYNISRNTIYDIKVTIDRAGGEIEKPVELKLKYVVDDWDNGGDHNLEFD